jgi:RNA polymerase sigma-70 factor (ECF subfamily)
VGVEEHHSQDHCDGEDSHVTSVELRLVSGQVPVVERGDDVGEPGSASGVTARVNGVALNGNTAEVTATASPLRFFAGIAPSAGVIPAVARVTAAEKAAAPTTEDEGVLRRAGSGDAAAFREIFVRHRGDVARLVYRMLGGPADLEDVVQEVFVQVYRSLKDFRGQSKFSTWLHRVTVNVVLMHRRSARSRPVLTDEMPSDVVADERQALPDEDFERLERMRAFQRLLARLADKKRIVFVLHELEGLPPTEIAEIVGAPVLTVRTRLFYARRELEQMLSQEPALAGLHASFTNAKSAEPDEGDG